MLSNDELTLLAERLHAQEFDHVFRLHPDGAITHPEGLWAPECYHDDERDITLCGAEDKWAPITGMTGQYGYHGAVMHPSEYIGRGVAKVLMEMVEDAERPIIFTLVVVDVLPDEEDDYPEPAGWAILYRKEDS